MINSICVSNMSTPTCPKCGKVFTKDSSVTRHLSQPRTSCHSSVRDMVDILEFTELVPPRRSLSPPQSSDRYTRSDIRDEPWQFDIAGDDMGTNIDGNQAVGGSSTSTEEWYKGAGTCYAQDGVTFLDLFDADEHAECRKDNIFYPFTSREEWEVADFLLRSPLSMAAIDQFLRLPMVCVLHGPFEASMMILLHRYANWNCRSIALKNCEVVLKCCQRDRAGSVKSSLRFMPRKAQSDYFGEIPSNV